MLLYGLFSVLISVVEWVSECGGVFCSGVIYCVCVCCFFMVIVFVFVVYFQWCILVVNVCGCWLGWDGRVVKAVDLRSPGVYPRVGSNPTPSRRLLEPSARSTHIGQHYSPSHYKHTERHARQQPSCVSETRRSVSVSH